jgi:hypothetical protein
MAIPTVIKPIIQDGSQSSELIDSGVTDKSAIGLSASVNSMLDELIEKKVFKDKLDGYRFAVSYAIAKEAEPPAVQGVESMYNVGQVDLGGNLVHAIEALMPNHPLTYTQPYRIVERLAHWGINEIYQKCRAGSFNFATLSEMSYE